MSEANKPPTVSVVIPTYRHADFVLLTLDSVFAQTWTDYEVIVVNDGSPDDTAARLQPLVQSGRVRYIEQTNAGQGAARNRGLAEARGEFVALLDDDDLWPPDKLAWQVDALRQNPDAAVVYGLPVPIDAQGQPLPAPDVPWLSRTPTGDVYEALMEENPLVSPGLCLIRREALLALGPNPFDPRIQGGCDDWDLWLRLARRSPFLFVDRPALFYRLHAGNASRDSLAMCRSSLALRRKWAVTETDPRRQSQWQRLARQAWSELATLLFAEAKQRGAQGRRGQQVLLTAQAFFLDTVFGVRKLSRMARARLSGQKEAAPAR